MTMQDIKDFLTGHKTYIIAICGALLHFAYRSEWIEANTHETLLVLLGGGGLAALRHGMTTTTAKQTAVIQNQVAHVEAAVDDAAAKTVQQTAAIVGKVARVETAVEEAIDDAADRAPSRIVRP